MNADPDLTRSAAAQTTLQDREEQLRLATEAADIGLWDVDLVSDTMYWPPRVKAMFGVSPDVAVSLDDFYNGLHPEDFEATATAFKAAIDPRQRALYDVEYRTVGKEDGVVRWVAAKGRGVFEDDGRCVRIIGIAIEITARKASEVALLRSEEQLREASRRKDQFIATLAHELRNPLAPLSNAIQLLKPPPEQTALRDIMRRQVDHLVRLVDDLMEVSRISTGALELRLAPVSMEAVIRNAVEASELLIRERGHLLQIDLPPDALWVRADAVRLAQILTNLLNNAARYTPPGGRIRMQAVCAEKDCRVVVTDTGQGFDAEQRGNMFEMFHRGKASTGLGIGLALARRLAEMHDGRIEATSPGPGLGACFTLHLNRVDAPRNDAGSALPCPAVGPMRVLVIDDNADAADTLALLLTDFGLNVQVARDGANGLKAFERHAPAVVFLDIGMPGMDGYEVARRLRQDFPQHRATIVGLSGWGQPDDVQRGREAGFDHHFVKPLDLDALLALLNRLAAASSA